MMKLSKKIFTLMFLMIVFTPTILSVAVYFYDLPYDVPVYGETKTNLTPVFSFERYLNGEFQNDFSVKFNQDFKPRGVVQRTYASIRYHLMNLASGDIIVGKDENLFFGQYINSELVINQFAVTDMRIEENQEKMDEYVQKLKTLNQKLSEYGKTLYLVISPNKAHFYSDDIPTKYKDYADPNAIRPVDAFRERISETEIPLLVTADLADEIDYPLFYKTGIHWSRPFEQRVSQRIIDDLLIHTGKAYNPMILENIVSRTTPFFRDSDIFDILGVWDDYSEDEYYEYSATAKSDNGYHDTINLLINGTSFSDGLYVDITTVYPNSKVYLINRDVYVAENGKPNRYFSDWSELALAQYLDKTDVVILESTETELTRYQNGFVEQLIDELGHYVPAEAIGNYISAFDTSSESPWNSESLSGISGREDGFAWMIYPAAGLTLQYDPAMSDNLEIEFEVPDLLFINDPDVPAVIDIYIDGERVSQYEFTEPERKIIKIDREILHPTKSYIELEIYCSKYFNPHMNGLGDDSRNLCLALTYAGKER